MRQTRTKKTLSPSRDVLRAWRTASWAPTVIVASLLSLGTAFGQPDLQGAASNPALPVSAGELTALPQDDASQGPVRLADRLAAVVEGEVITLTDIQWLIAYRNLQPPQQARQLEAFRLSILEQIIEEKLIANEARRTPGVKVGPAEVDRQVEGYRSRFPDPQAFRAQLEQMEMDLSDLRSLIGRQLAVLRFLRVRFEPFIIVLPDEIDDYYNNRLLPELEESGQSPPQLELVQEEIREILTVEKTNLEIERWVRDQRQKSEVTVLLGRSQPQFSNLPLEILDGGQVRPLERDRAVKRP